MKILVPLDRSPFAEEVLDWVSCMAGETSGSEIHLIHVVVDSKARATWVRSPGPGRENVSPLDGSGGAAGAGVLAETRDQAFIRVRQEAEDYLAGVAEHRLTRGAVVRVLSSHSPAQEIVEYARRHGVLVPVPGCEEDHRDPRELPDPL